MQSSRPTGASGSSGSHWSGSTAPSYGPPRPAGRGSEPYAAAGFGGAPAGGPPAPVVGRARPMGTQSQITAAISAAAGVPLAFAAPAEGPGPASAVRRDSSSPSAHARISGVRPGQDAGAHARIGSTGESSRAHARIGSTGEGSGAHAAIGEDVAHAPIGGTRARPFGSPQDAPLR